MTETLLDALQWRGLVHQITDEALARRALARGTTAYIGFDPTGPSLHVGSLLQIMTLRRLQQGGSRPIALIGGGTGLIGDPSGKSAERNLLDDDTVGRNTEAITAQLRRFLHTDGDQGAIFVDNGDWLRELGLVAFLRDIGKHFSVNAMVQRDSVRTRLEGRDQGISFTEFSYMLLQAYDFLALYGRFGCQAQLGGSDQWGNIVSGIDLIRRLADARVELPGGDVVEGEDAHAFGVTSPLITTRSGQKFGKTEEGAIWLDANRTSPYAFFQYWLNLDDDDAARGLAYFTDLPREEIDALLADHERAPGRRVAHRRLAEEVTRLVHGDEGLRDAERATQVLFSGEIEGVQTAQLQAIFADVPSADLRLATDAPLPAMALLCGRGEDVEGEGRFACASGGDAKRALKAGSVLVNGQRLGADPRADVRPLLRDGHLAVVRLGKKRYFLVRVGAA